MFRILWDGEGVGVEGKVFDLLFYAFIFLSLPILTRRDALLRGCQAVTLSCGRSLGTTRGGVTTDVRMRGSTHTSLGPGLSNTTDFRCAKGPVRLALSVPSVKLSGAIRKGGLGCKNSLSVLRPICAKKHMLRSVHVTRRRRTLTNGRTGTLGSTIYCRASVRC